MSKFNLDNKRATSIARLATSFGSVKWLRNLFWHTSHAQTATAIQILVPEALLLDSNSGHPHHRQTASLIFYSHLSLNRQWSRPSTVRQPRRRAVGGLSAIMVLNSPRQWTLSSKKVQRKTWEMRTSPDYTQGPVYVQWQWHVRECWPCRGRHLAVTEFYRRVRSPNCFICLLSSDW